MAIGMAAVLLLLLLLYVYHTWWIDISEYRIQSDVVKAPFTFVHLSDIHGLTAGVNGRLSRLVSESFPDFILITGDLATNRRQLPRVLREIGRFPRETAIYFVPGNYEREESVLFRKRPIDDPGYLSRLQSCMNVLENDSVSFRCKGSLVHLYGLDNSVYGNERIPSAPNAGAPDPATAPFSIVMAHCPSIIRYLQEQSFGFHLLLAGHTHGGQIRCFGRTWGAYRDYPIGLSRLGHGRYFGISRGLGTVKLPVRLNCRPEIAVYRIEPAETSGSSL